MSGQIVAMGGGTFLAEDDDPRINAFVLSLTGSHALACATSAQPAAIESTACMPSTAQ